MSVERYQILKSDDRNTLVESVNNYLASDWKLYGSPFVMPANESEPYPQYCQAMVYNFPEAP